VGKRGRGETKKEMVAADMLEVPFLAAIKLPHLGVTSKAESEKWIMSGITDQRSMANKGT
jgi:hypothetical protein